ncbi:hypothetical protein IMZ31_23145 (plasmid) [Pontibacillus sp. ALD_SL1]|uniref:hypothetical protein n=1 Tax=Pontibacillus sp. ALD_SL1 TaxID=2777185 RepID=UPI001A9638FD|nr:hypothetical protein [Pontibacillus sp. ALD_SL1]QST02350.1 hypothetical protein IMZ31_23145 [Pontibacillus sp. ALD_SL1]
MDTKMILEELNKRSFSPELKKVFLTFSSNADRIEFVKDHYGFTNFIYLPELSKDHTDSDEYFLSLECTEKEEEETAVLYFEIKDIESNLDLFFQESSERLYIHIDFNESKMMQEEVFRAYNDLIKEPSKSLDQALSSYRSFPDWYPNQTSRSVLEREDLIEQMDLLDQRMHEKFIPTILPLIESSVAKGDHEQFKVLTRRLINFHNTQ